VNTIANGVTIPVIAKPDSIESRPDDSAGFNVCQSIQPFNERFPSLSRYKISMVTVGCMYVAYKLQFMTSQGKMGRESMNRWL
jgi:hypothetical protein